MHFSLQQTADYSSDQESEHLVTGGAALPNDPENHVVVWGQSCEVTSSPSHALCAFVVEGSMPQVNSPESARAPRTHSDQMSNAACASCCQPVGALGTQFYFNRQGRENQCNNVTQFTAKSN